MRRAGRRLAARVAGSRAGRRLIEYVALERPEILLGALGWSLTRRTRFGDVVGWPRQLRGFEDVAPLVLSSNAANRGLMAMSVVEAAHLWRLASEAGAGTLVEIGRERGGSTFLIAAGMAPGATLYSYDPQTKLGSLAFDDDLRAALRRYGLESRVRILVEDSHTAQVPDGEYRLVLVDGDPSYDGTRVDFERFCRRLAPGGDALLHDAASGGPRHPQLKRLIQEVERDTAFQRQPDVGTFVHFVHR